MVFTAVAAAQQQRAPAQPKQAAAQQSYAQEMKEWQRERGEYIRRTWVPLVGLFWLSEGENEFGADARLPVPLPEGTAPERAGVFELRGGKVSMRAAQGVELAVNGKPVRQAQLAPDSSGKPDVITLGDLTMRILERNGRMAVRIRQENSPAQREFRGLEFYPIRPALRLEGRFVPYEKPRDVLIPTVTGHDITLPSPGYVTFRLNGREHRLEPVLESPGAKELFFVFRDATAGKGTYPGGRYLYTPLPQNGRVVMDFNRAANPPCAFTAFATCPLPPPQNSLPMAIEAGERYKGGN